MTSRPSVALHAPTTMGAKPLIIAHRGLPQQAPENTLPSFAAALSHEPDFVELDYQHSADGVPVVFHDDTLDRTTDALRVFGRGGIAVGDLTFDELRRLDAGRWFDPQFAGTRIPSLAEAVELVCPRRPLMIERKSGDAESLVRLICSKNVVDRVAVRAFDWSFIAECRRLGPSLDLGCLGEGLLTAERAAEAVGRGATMLGWNERDLNAEAIEIAHAAGLRVWAWTVNAAPRAGELVAAGLDGLITDCADVARSW